MDFSDPSNVKSLIAAFPVGNPSNILAYVNNVLPAWVLEYADGFSLELARFNIEWAQSCVALGVEPKKVLLVTDVFLKTQRTTHQLVKKAIESLLVSGYIVMDVHNFGTCKECGDIIVCEERLKEKNYSFSGKCQKCFKYDPRKPLSEEKSD